MKKNNILLSALILLLVLAPIKALQASDLASSLKGKILLQVEQNGEAWYVNPADNKRYFLGRPADAFNLMRELGIGISNSDLEKIPVSLDLLSGTDSDGDGLPDIFEDAIGTDKYKKDTDGDGFDDAAEIRHGYDPRRGDGARLPLDHNFAAKHKGKIFLQAEQSGEAWYVNPTDSKRYFLGRPADAFNVMRSLGLGITDKNLSTIPAYHESLRPDTGDDDPPIPDNSGNDEQKIENFDEEWNVYLEYLSAIQSRDFDKLISVMFDAYDYSDFYEADEEEIESLWLFLKYGTELLNLAKEDIYKVWKDEKQSILSTKIKKIDSGYEKTRLFFGQINGETKIISISHTMLIDEESYLDSDQDGRFDKDETCSGPFYEYGLTDCLRTDPNKRDTDGDGWWDGVELEAGSDPNDKEITPLNMVYEELYNDNSEKYLSEEEMNSAILLTEEETKIIYKDSELIFKTLVDSNKYVGFSSGLDENEGNVNLYYYDETGRYIYGFSSKYGGDFTILKDNYGDYIYLKVASVAGNEITIYIENDN